MHRICVPVLLAASCVAGTAAAAVPSVPAGHPRVYVRPADLSAIRAKLLLPEFADAWSQVSASTKPLCKALVYLLEENTSIGNAAVAEGLVELQAVRTGASSTSRFTRAPASTTGATIC